MYAIVEVLGKQYRVQEGQKVVVDLMDAEKGSEISLDRVLMIGGEAAKIGTPVVEGAKVNATVVDHILGDKIVGNIKASDIKQLLNHWMSKDYAYTTEIGRAHV